MAKSKNPGTVGRRSFLSSAAIAGAASTLAAPAPAAAQEKPKVAAAARPTAQQLAAETKPIEGAPGTLHGRPGSDYMVDVIKSLGIEYVAANPGSSFRGFQESIATYGGNEKPEFLTCLHEESSVAMAHGYAKIALKPMAFMAHGTVGLQHASMAIYNAWCDRVPMIGILGNTLNAVKRRPGVEWLHSAQDPAGIVRDFTKWDDQPASLQHFGESMVRAYKLTMTPPMEPVIITADGDLQEDPIEGTDAPTIPRYTAASPPAGDMATVREVAKLLVNAELPLIVADRAARTPEGMRLLVELAETLACPVIDQGSRANFPNTHPMAMTERGGGLIRRADVILGLELTDFWGTVHDYIDNIEREYSPRTKAGCKLIGISSNELFIKANYQDFERFAELDISIAADAEATLPGLIEACRALIDGNRASAIKTRFDAMTKMHNEARAESRENATLGWDASPISTARLSAEMWNAIKDEDWSLLTNYGHLSSWPHRLWTFDKHYRHIGHAGGAGVGYGIGAAVGAALANRPHGRLSVSIQCDGDLMYAPGSIWTAVHHKIPLLSVMHNNRAYHQEIMHLQRMQNRRQRGVDRAWIGCTITDPNIDYAMLAKSMGMWAEGPITNPKDLGPALKRAVAVVKRGEPALLDVVTQPR